MERGHSVAVIWVNVGLVPAAVMPSFKSIGGH